MKRRETLSTRDEAYSARRSRAECASWKRWLNAQAPYRWNLRRLKPGFTLDIGCGIGRNLAHLNGNGVGIDHNPHSVDIARSRGFQAFTPEDFAASAYNTPEQFDSILLSHVAEHMTCPEVVDLLNTYTGPLKPRGLVIIITPQELGFKSDSTHVEFMDFEKLRGIALEAGLATVQEYSFPFPRIFGRLFKYNEFVSVSMKR